MSPTSTCVIANPKSGSALVDLPERLAALGGKVDVWLTTRESEATDFARTAVRSGYGRIIAAGGDGTINEVINGIAPDFETVEFAVLPLGTGNDFARSINLPSGDFPAAVNVILRGQTRAVDIVRVFSDRVRHFINVSAAGFSGAVNEKLTDEMKKTWGPLAYLRSAAAALPDLTDHHTVLVLDERETLEMTAYNVVVANARYVAGGIPIAPEAVLDDGLLDLVILPASSLPRLALIVPLMLTGKHWGDESLVCRRARKLEIQSEPGMWFNVDGELVGNEPATFEVLPRALRVVVGPEPTDSVMPEAWGKLPARLSGRA